MDAHPEILILVVALPCLLGLLSARYLHTALLRVLTDECGTRERAEFWTRLTALGMALAPTALALYAAGAWQAPLSPAELVRSLLSISLNGVLMVLAFMAFAMWRQIPARVARGGASARSEWGAS